MLSFTLYFYLHYGSSGTIQRTWEVTVQDPDTKCLQPVDLPLQTALCGCVSILTRCPGDLDQLRNLLALSNLQEVPKIRMGISQIHKIYPYFIAVVCQFKNIKKQESVYLSMHVRLKQNHPKHGSDWKSHQQRPTWKRRGHHPLRLQECVSFLILPN